MEVCWLSGTNWVSVLGRMMAKGEVFKPVSSEPV